MGMNEEYMVGKIDDVICDGLFDNIEDFFNFTNDDVVLEVAGSAAAGLPSATPFPSLDGGGCRVTSTSEENKICDDINLSEDWISKFLDDNTNFDMDFAADVTTTGTVVVPNNSYTTEDESLFHSFSPISVLEPSNLSLEKGSSSSSSSASSSSSISFANETDTVSFVTPVGPTMMLVPSRARSKRPSRAALPSADIPVLPPSSDGPPEGPILQPKFEAFEESSPSPPMKKKKKDSSSNASADETTLVRKCLHCGIQKTPQWRAGPMGPKTLCNACGVRYKSGRLFPEYRPAASPTFVPSVHSNSHKKVVEMRIKACQQKPTNVPKSPAAKNCDLLAYIRRE